jgi:catechol 2,3-dioxygenase-like lactoylglutathione lyase family enzyme
MFECCGQPISSPAQRLPARQAEDIANAVLFLAATSSSPNRPYGAAAASPEDTMLDHVTLRTADIEGTRAFLEAVLELKPGYRPAFPFPGYWLYAEGKPIVHLIPGRGGTVDRAGEIIDNAAFRFTDYDGMRRKLENLAIPYTEMELLKLGERRLFIRTPTGTLLELVFRKGRAVLGGSEHEPDLQTHPSQRS